MNTSHEEGVIRDMEREELKALLRTRGLDTDPELITAIQAYARACSLTSLALRREHRKP